MPKRKSVDDIESLSRKLRKLEQKIRRKKRRLSYSSDSSVPSRNKEDEDTPRDLPLEVLDTDPIFENIGSGETSQVNNMNNNSFVDDACTSANSAANLTVPEHTEPCLDQDILDILGVDPTKNIKYGKDTNADLAVRLEHFSTSGLSKEVRKELCEKYLIPNNCKLIDAPLLNAEIKAALTESTAKRDKHIEYRQKQVATTLSCLSEALSLLFSAQNKDTNLIRLLMDATRILCDCQYNDSITRRNFVLSSLKKDMKDQLQSTKLTNLLFGENLTETIKVAKAINKSGADLKASVPPKPAFNKKPIPSTSKNWKPQFPAKKPPPANQKPRESVPQKTRPSTSYKQSQPRQYNSRR